MATIRLETLGPLEITCGDPDSAARVIAQPKRLAVLVYLAARPPGERVSRDRLLAMFWPELSPSRARAALRNALYFLRRALGPDVIAGDGTAVRLAPGTVSCDASVLLSDPESRTASELLDLYHGEFLDGLHVPDAPAFEHWIDRMRATLRARATELAWGLADAAEAEGQWITAAGHARTAVELAVDVEGASQRLIRLLDRAGDRAAALGEHERLAAWLEDEFDVRPSPETTSLIEHIRARGTERPGPPHEAAHGRGRVFRSVAVLPFEDLSGAGTNFASGLAEDLLTGLCTLQGIRVVSRTSVQRFATERPRSMRAVRDVLGVDLVVEGSVRVDDERVRVTAQLVDAARDAHLWAQTWDRPLTDVFEVQSDIALRIVRSLDVELSPDQHRRLRNAPTRSLEAYQLYLRGRQVWAQRKPRDAEEAVALFRRALAVEPGFASAWVGLADAHLMRALTVEGALPDAGREAKKALDRALAIDPASGEARASLGVMLTFLDWDQPRAEREYAQAVELSPGHAPARQWYGQWLSAHGRTEEGLAEVDAALELDLLSPAVNEGRGLALYHAGRIAEAAAQFERTLELDPEYWRAPLALSLCHAAAGDAERSARAMIRAWEGGAGGGTPAEARRAGSRLRDGVSPALESLLRCARDRAPHVPATRVIVVLLLMLLGRHREAIDALEAARRERSLGFVVIYAPMVDPLARDARFRVLLSECGLLLPRWRR